MVKKPIELPSTISSWDHLFGIFASLLVFLVPLFPDEKLIRLKLQVLEYGIFVLAGFAVLRILWDEKGISPGFFQARENRPRVYVYLAVAIWFLSQAILWFISPEKSLANAEERRICLAAASFLSFSLFPLKSFWKKIFYGSWALAAGLLSLYGILQVSGGIGPIQVPQMPRPMANCGNAIFFAAFLLTSIFVTWAAISLFKKDKFRFLAIFFLALEVLALWFAQTRAAWIGFGAALLVGILWKFGIRRIPIWVWPLVLVLGGIFIFQTKNVWMRDQAHLLIWRDTLKMWKDHPVAGVGLGAFHTNFVQYASDDLKKKWPQGEFIVNYAHNEFVQILAEGGLLGLLAFLLIFIFFFKYQFGPALARWKGEESIFLTLGVLGLLVQNFFSVDMRFSISLSTLFILMGLSLASEEIQAAPVPAFGLSQRIPNFFRIAGSGIWIFFLGAVILPVLRRPYLAQKAVSEQKDFFNERLLDPAKTVADLEDLAARYPREPLVMERLAFAYAKEIKTPQGKTNGEMANKAISSYQKVIQIDPGRLGAYNNLANIYYTLGNSAAAIDYWNRALAVDPQFLEGHLNLGKVLYVRGRLKESAAHFEKVLQIDPKNSEAVVYLRKMVE